MPATSIAAAHVDRRGWSGVPRPGRSGDVALGHRGVLDAAVGGRRSAEVDQGEVDALAAPHHDPPRTRRRGRRESGVGGGR